LLVGGGGADHRSGIMARIDDLLTQVSDAALRQKLEAALADMKRRQRFGLVFEDHVPETTALVGAAINEGSVVQRRDTDQDQLYVVRRLSGTKATIEPESGGKTTEVRRQDLLAVRRFGEPIRGRFNRRLHGHGQSRRG